MLRAAPHTLPASLEQRGTAVPFTTPALALARVRPDPRHELVLAIRGFGGEGSYVIPWKSVPEVTSMSIHDKALHGEIAETGALTPAAVRRAALKIASTGLAGPAACEAAKRAIEEDERKALETHFLLIISLLAAAEVNVSELVRNDPGAGEWRDKARQLLEEAADKAGAQAAGFFERSASLSRTLAPVGLSQAPSGSRVRDLLKSLGEFKDSLEAWSQVEKSEFGAAAEYATELADATMVRASHVLSQFDSRTSDPRWILRDWRLEVTVCTAIANRLAWLLDGWDYVTALWGTAGQEDIVRQRDVVGQLVPLLPLVPSETARARPNAPILLGGHKSATGPDPDASTRLEAAKARATGGR
jgi:hypothetical protein